LRQVVTIVAAFAVAAPIAISGWTSLRKKHADALVAQLGQELGAIHGRLQNIVKQADRVM
jgi:hypothetical protein